MFFHDRVFLSMLKYRFIFPSDIIIIGALELIIKRYEVGNKMPVVARCLRLNRFYHS